MNITSFLQSVKEEQAALEDAVFRSPPKDYGEFQGRLGHWLGLEKAKELLQRQLDEERRQEEQDEA